MTPLQIHQQSPHMYPLNMYPLTKSRVSLFLCLLAVSVILVGCGGDDGPEGPVRVATFPVTGTVTVDGAVLKLPAKVSVRAYPEAGVESSPTKSTPNTFTLEDGSFALGTYEKSDGIPPGTYTLTFEVGMSSLLSGRFDPLPEHAAINKKYNDPKTSTTTVTVTGSETEPVSVGTIDLTAE